MGLIKDRRFDLLILDYGGVYSFERNPDSFCTIMFETFGKVPNANERRDINACSHQLAAGHMSSRQYVANVARVLNVSRPSTEVFESNTIACTLDPSSEMVELVEEVRSLGIRVALLSDMFMFEVIRTRPWGRYDNFDYVAFSAEQNLTKSDSKLFLRVINHFGVTSARTLFVDDVAKNVGVARDLGMQTIHVTDDRFDNAGELANTIRIRLLS